MASALNVDNDMFMPKTTVKVVEEEPELFPAHNPEIFAPKRTEEPEQLIVNDDDVDIDEYINNYGNHTISFLGFKIETKNLALPLVSILIGFVDGFNPCAMWVLLFLISMLIYFE